MTEEWLAFLPLEEQAQLIRSRELSPVDLCELYLRRIDRFNRKLNAYITVCAEQALAAARRAEEEIGSGRYLGPLHGIPVAVKDQMLIEGVRVTGASKVHAEHIADRDATVIARLKRAGAVLLGTLNSHEFHLGPTIDFPYGTPRNPWNLERNPGGSSSGSAAAVAAGLCSASLGGDTGGSIRAPAAFCGVVGLKPTWSRVSRDGVFPLAWSLDCVGPLTRSAEGAALTLQALAGRDARDPTSSRAPVPDYRERLAGDLAGVRIGVVEEMIDSSFTGEEAGKAVVAALEILRQRGATVTEASLPLMSETRFLSPALTKPEAASYHRQQLLRRYLDYDYNTRVGLMVGAILPAGVVSLAQRARVVVATQVLDALRHVDVLVGASTSGGAAPIGERLPIRSKAEALERLYGLGAAPGQHTRVFSLAGVPALSVPCGFDADGLPLGLHVAGRPFDETSVLRVGDAFQRDTDWHRQRPPIA